MRPNFSKSILAILALLLIFTGSAIASPEHSNDQVSASPKSPWGDFTIVEEKEAKEPWYVPVLLWIPNRLMDAIDIFRVDVGVGKSLGAVVRLSKYGQVGYRSVSPASIRLGLFGRRAPVLVERSSEFGIGPGYFGSKDRKICPGEVGVGVDLLIVGGYGGVCIDEALDFLAGLFFLDPEKDDLR